MREEEKIYSEKKLLCSKDKNFFPSKIDTTFCHYNKLIKIILENLNKADLNQEIEKYILNEIYEHDYGKVFSLINSHLDSNNNDKIKKELKIKKHLKHQQSFNFQKENVGDFNNLKKCYTIDNSSQSKLFDNLTLNSFKDNVSDKNTEYTKEEDDYILQIKEINSLENANNELIDNNSVKELIGSFSNSDKNINKKKRLSFQSFIAFNPTLTFGKTSNQSFNSGNTNESNFKNILSYLNYFFQPDEYFLRNSKKQLFQ